MLMNDSNGATRQSSPRKVARRVVSAVGLVSLVAGTFTLSAVSANAEADLPAVLLDSSSTWKYSATDTDPAAGTSPYNRFSWTTRGFDDSAWSQGHGSFGAKVDGSGVKADLGGGFVAQTVLPLKPSGSNDDIRTYHFRTSFNLTADQLAAIDGVEVTATYDDAPEFIVNGAKVQGYYDGRVTSAPVDQQNLIYAGESNGDPRTSTFTIPAGALVAGENSLAVALHQDRASSSDIYLDVTKVAPVAKDAQESAVISDIVLGVGSDESQRNLAWYSSADTAQVAQIAKASDVVDGVFPADATTVAATGGPTTSGEYNRFATLTGLEENTVYTYRVGAEGSWSAPYSFRTQSFSGDFDFLFFGDPQVGASGNLASDGVGWQDTLDVALATYPDAEMLFSAGDQVNSANDENQYTTFLTPDALREVPFVATNGNHDVGSKAYEQHFNTPNTDRTAGPGSGSSSGGDYWFIYKDVLFVDINSNSRDYASHNRFMEQVVAEHGDEAKWKVLAFHHSIYSPGPHATDSDINDRRNTMPQVISDLGFDLVLQGHDHTYARSYLINDGEKANADEQAGADSVVAGPGDVLYVTSNSASGSKYYELQNKGFWWLSVQNQEHVRNYTAVEVSDGALTVKTLRSQANGADMPVNSVVDEVTLTRAADGTRQQLQVEVPQAAPGEFVWSIDGSNDLVDLGTATEDGDHFQAAGAINPIRVTDTRRPGAQWAINAQVGDFTAGDESFSGKYLGWTPKVTEPGGGANAGAPVISGFVSGDGLSVSQNLGNAETGHPTGSAQLGADLDLKLPIDVTDGTYQATLTLTALA